MFDTEVDLEQRDPNSINAHLGTVKYDEVFGEPDGIRSIDCVWKFSMKCFECWKDLCYKISTTLCGICIAMMWGCEFAYVAFYHIWFITPTFRWLEINCQACQKVYTMCISCCLTPLFESCGGMFIHFKK